MKSMRLVNLFAGPALFAAASYLLPESVFPTFAARAAIGTVAWMSYWWVTAPVDYAVTAFLPIVLNAIFGMVKMNGVIAQYASETIILLLGASIITVSWEETGVDRRIAAALLRLVGNGLKRQVVFWFLLSVLLSAVMPNAVVCATLTPIACAMLKYAGEGDISTSAVGSRLLLAIAYAAGVGGLATPLGGAMNLVTVDYIEKLTGEEYMYIDWVVHMAPIMLVIVVSNILFLVWGLDNKTTLGGSSDYFEAEYKKFKPMTSVEWWSLILFVVATTLSFTRQFYKDLLPGMKPAYVFMTCAVLSFLVSRHNGERLMVWRSVQKKIVWEMVYIFAGGLALGVLIKDSGAAAAIGSFVSETGVGTGMVAAFVFIAVPMILSDVTSNTATAAVVIPIVISIVAGMGKSPQETLPYIYAASIGVNLSYMLPTSIRAIPVGYGLKPSLMLKVGWKITLVELVLLTLVSWAMMTYFPKF